MTEEENLNYSIQSKKIWFEGVWAWQGRLLCEQAGVSQVFEVIDTASFGFGGLGLVKFWSPGICWFDVFIILNFGLDLNILNLRSDFSTSNLNMVLVFFFSSWSRVWIFISRAQINSCIFLKLKFLILDWSRFCLEGDLGLGIVSSEAQQVFKQWWQQHRLFDLD